SVHEAICAVAYPRAGAARSVSVVEPVNANEQVVGQSIAPAGSLVTRPCPWTTIVTLPATAPGFRALAAGSAETSSASSASEATADAHRPSRARRTVPQRLPFRCI